LAIKDADGHVWIGTAGVADIGASSPVTVNTHFKIGSITKTFTVMTALTLVDAGILGLDDPVEKWLPGLLPAGARITIRHLMAHTAGLYAYTSDASFNASLAKEPLRRWKPEEQVALSAAHPLLFTPGDTFAYSNTNCTVLGMIIEKATGRPLNIVMKQRVLNPLGMSQTSFPVTPEMPRPYAHGYMDINENGVLEADEISTHVDPSIPWASGNMISDAADLLRWADALCDGELLSRKLNQERLKWLRVNGPPDVVLHFALGISDADGAVGHLGEVYGYSAAVYRCKDVEYAILTNGSSPTPIRNFVHNMGHAVFERARPIMER
jgi:D-alanyl-D-alanine carboxypeptidase